MQRPWSTWIGAAPGRVGVWSGRCKGSEGEPALAPKTLKEHRVRVASDRDWGLYGLAQGCAAFAAASRPHRRGERLAEFLRHGTHMPTLENVFVAHRNVDDFDAAERDLVPSDIRGGLPECGG